ncbi:hypothetical protein NEOLEDRAFT_1151608 [Neolentinus lepideus HHB14362 ss-1]|uniref:Uncharacterized protein n=1 Tax=Neolentinus lepideus HHB14362 ss-1 TaxID=1314782 RepID=A0A165NSW8_9AGAM|nr:hypothetical protein NEOLEDRAFT_1151608 [Neolentinus lepideus HHB14362 ss-1]
MVNIEVKVKQVGQSDKCLGILKEIAAKLLHSGTAFSSGLTSTASAARVPYWIEFHAASTSVSDAAKYIADQASEAVGRALGTSSASAAVSSMKEAWEPLLRKLKILCSVTGVASEIHPYAKMALTVLTAVPKVILQGAEHDAKIHDLVVTMNATFSFAEDVKDLPDQVSHQKEIIWKMLHQSIECGYFIKNYVEDKTFDTDALIEKFKAIFASLQQAFVNHAVSQTQILSVQIINDLKSASKY